MTMRACDLQRRAQCAPNRIRFWTCATTSACAPSFKLEPPARCIDSSLLVGRGTTDTTRNGYVLFHEEGLGGQYVARSLRFTTRRSFRVHPCSRAPSRVTGALLGIATSCVFTYVTRKAALFYTVRVSNRCSCITSGSS